MKQAQAVFGNGSTLGDIILMNLHCFAVQRLQQRRPVILQMGFGGFHHLAHRPAEIHRRRPGRAQQLAVDLQFPIERFAVSGVDPAGQHIHTVSGADPDGRCATDAEFFDGLHHLLKGTQLDFPFLVGKQCLVNDVQPLRVLIVADVLHMGHPADIFLHRPLLTHTGRGFLSGPCRPAPPRPYSPGCSSRFPSSSHSGPT